MSSPPKLSKQMWEQLRDWLVPEEEEPSYRLTHWDRWDERQRLRALLTTEADRAERGE